MIEHRLENISVLGNVVMTCRNEILEKSVAKLIKIKDSADNCKACVQHNYSDNCI